MVDDDDDVVVVDDDVVDDDDVDDKMLTLLVGVPVGDVAEVCTKGSTSFPRRPKIEFFTNPCSPPNSASRRACCFCQRSSRAWRAKSRSSAGFSVG
jgi:hypothetical protein